jgi:hypothetical protein
LHPAHTCRFFYHDRGHLRENSLSHSDAITPHVMRHTAITKLVTALRYTHVHRRHIDQAIQPIGRSIPKRSVNGTTNTTSQKLHQAPPSHAPGKGTGRPKLKAV